MLQSLSLRTNKCILRIWAAKCWPASVTKLLADMTGSLHVCEKETPNDHNFEATEEAYNFLHRTEEEEIGYRKRALENPHQLWKITFEKLPAIEWFEARKSERRKELYARQPELWYSNRKLMTNVPLDEESLQATKSQQNTPQPGTECTERRREKQFGGLKKGFLS